MKRIIFFLILFSSALTVLAQTPKPTRNIGREQTVPLSTTVGIPAIVDSAGKKVGRLINPAEIATNAQLSLKASQSQLSDTSLQLRSDLATKSEVQNIPALAAFKDKVVAERSYPIGFNNDFSAKTIAQVTGNLATSPNYQTDGWYKFSFYTYKSGSVLNSLNDYSSTESLSITGLPANSGSNTPLYFTTTAPQNFNGATAMRNGDYLMLLVINRQMVTWYTGTNDLATKKAIEMIRDSLSAKASAADVALKAPQTALDAEAAARVAGDALRPTFTNLSDSLTGVWRVQSTTPAFLDGYSITLPTPFVSNPTKVVRYGINLKASPTATDEYSFIGASTSHNFFNVGAGRSTIGSSRFFPKGYFGIWGMAGGGFQFFGTNVVSYNRADSIQDAYARLLTFTSSNKQLSFGNGVGVTFDQRRNNLWGQAGLQFYNQLNQDSIDFAYNPQKGHLISIRDEGKLAVKRRDGNLITTYDRVLTDNEVKSKSLTLATSSTPALDFESGVNITYTLTTALAGNFFPTTTLTNIRDGGRYAIRFNALHTGNVFTFPANVYKKDGTAFGAYSVVSEILDFVAIGSNLYCINK